MGHHHNQARSNSLPSKESKVVLDFQTQVSLAPLTTLQVGGVAKRFLRLRCTEEVQEFAAWWRATPVGERPVVLALGGGSNLLVSDQGFSGLVVKLENKEWEILHESDTRVVLRVGAGTVWDDFVARTVALGLAGVECLSGIPGCVGAAPVQNIGAYGQEVSETIVGVEGLDLRTGLRFSMTAQECGFCYRDSMFKRGQQGSYLITSVLFQLSPGAPPTLRYQDLRCRCPEGCEPSLEEVRAMVLEVRRSKSMVYDPNDPNHRSAGSFFTNPIVDQSDLVRLEKIVGPEVRMPHYPFDETRVKLSAAWLIENSGLPKGFRPTPDAKVGLSSRHVLALINRGGASSAELVNFSDFVRNQVFQKFQVKLVPEPVFVGF